MSGVRSSATHNATASLSKRGHLGTPGGNPMKSIRKVRLALEGTRHVVETYGGSLPVVVTEVLSRIEDPETTFVTLSPSGWAWLVANEKLLIWKYHSQASFKASSCRELPLPSSFSSGLACVLESASQHDVSCLYSTLDGHLRYWSSICREANYVDWKVDLKGQQTKTLCAVDTRHAVLATDNSSIYLVTLGETITKCQELVHSVGGGMLSGISRRMSFIFGSGPSPNLSEPLIQVISNSHGEVIVLTSGHFQKWSLTTDSAVMRYQCNLEELLFIQMSACLSVQDYSFIPKDMQWTRGGVGLILSVTRTATPDITYYVAVIIDVSRHEQPTSAVKVTLLDYASDYKDYRSSVFRLIPCDADSQQFFLLDGLTVACADASSGIADRLRFLPTERILGVCATGGTQPILFCLHEGVVTIKGSGPGLNLSLLGGSATVKISKRLDQNVQDVSSSTISADFADEKANVDLDGLQKLKARFMLWLKDGQPSGSFTSDRDRLQLAGVCEPQAIISGVSLLSQQIIDDLPANDPRWAEESFALHASRELSVHQQQIQSVLLANQLQEKEKAHNLYRHFLATTGLLEKLLGGSAGCEVVASVFDHAKKIAVAKALLDVSGRAATIVESAIKLVIGRRGHDIARNVTPHDVFFTELSKIDDIFDALVAYEEKHLGDALSSVNTVKEVNAVVLNVVYCLVRHNESTMTTEAYQRAVTGRPSRAGRILGSLRVAAEKQYTVTLTQLHSADDNQTRLSIYQQLAELADAILADYAEMVATCDDGAAAREEFERVHREARDRLLQPFVDLGQYERAASLAEKYFDFQLLIDICELTNNQKRLQNYLERYRSQGFLDVLFHYYVREGKLSKLLRLSTPVTQLTDGRTEAAKLNEDLENFLKLQRNSELTWLHDVGLEHFSKACQSLLHLADSEKTFLAKKKTLYSLGKLAILARDETEASAAEDSEYLYRIDRELAIILHQEQLPSYVIKDLGMDARDMHVLTPAEVVEGYVGKHNASASERDFLRAIDLVKLLENDVSFDVVNCDVHSLRLHIWSRVVLRDDWLALANTATSSANLIETLRNTIFMRLIDLLTVRHAESGIPVGKMLPSLQDLSHSPELAHLFTDAKFRYMIQAAYEHVSQ